MILSSSFPIASGFTHYSILNDGIDADYAISALKSMADSGLCDQHVSSSLAELANGDVTLVYDSKYHLAMIELSKLLPLEVLYVHTFNPNAFTYDIYAYVDGKYSKITKSIVDKGIDLSSANIVEGDETLNVSMESLVSGLQYQHESKDIYVPKVVAVMAYDAKTLGVGKNNKMSWIITEEMQSFLSIMESATCIVVGRNTFVGLPDSFVKKYFEYIHVFKDGRFESLASGEKFKTLSDLKQHYGSKYFISNDFRKIHIIGGPKTLLELNDEIDEYILSEVVPPSNVSISYDSYFDANLLAKIKANFKREELDACYSHNYQYVRYLYKKD